MKRDILVVVDMQRDFVDGALGSKDAEAIVPKVVEKVNAFQGDIYFTLDTHVPHYLETQEGKHLPVPHCIEGSEGWQLVPGLEELVLPKEAKKIVKPTFGSWSLGMELKELHEKEGLNFIEVVGLCTDICVISNALLLKAFVPEVPIYCDAACCAGVTKEKHEAALETMRSCQIIVTNAE